MSSTNDPKYDRGVKKLFGAYTEEDDDGERILKNEDLENLLQDFEICPQLAEWEEVAEALQNVVQGDREGMNFHEFKKFLRKVAVNEFKKKKYEHRFPSHDQRHNALLAYLRADDVDALLERAHECQMLQRSTEEDVGHNQCSPNDSQTPPRSKKSSSGKKDKKSSSSKQRKTASSGHENNDEESRGGGGARNTEVRETVEERIKRKQEEALAAKRAEKTREEQMRRQAVEEIRIEYGQQQDVPRGVGAGGRPQSAASDGSSISRSSRPESAASRPESAARGRSGGSASGGERMESSMWGAEDGAAALNLSGLRGIDEDKSGWSGGWADGDDDGQSSEYAERGHVSFDEHHVAHVNDAPSSARGDGGGGGDDDEDVLIQEDDDEGDSCDEQMDAIIGSNGVIGLAHTEEEEGGLAGHHARGGSPHLIDNDDPSALAPRSRPQSSRPPSAGRHLRPESARPNRDKLGSPAPGGMVGGGAGVGVGEEACFQLECCYGTATGTTRVEERSSWQDVCSAIRRLFGMPPGAPVVLTYKIREGGGGGGGRQVACSSQSDFVRLVSYVAQYPPAQGVLAAQILMMKDEGSLPQVVDQAESEGSILSSGLVWQDASLLGRELGEHEQGREEPSGSSLGAHRPASADSAPPDTSDRVEYVPGAGLTDRVSPRDGEGWAYHQGKRPTVNGGDLVRPHSSSRPLSANTLNRPVSATSRPVSAPRAMRSADGGCPQGPVLQATAGGDVSAPSRDLAIRNAGGGISRGLDDDATKDNVASRGGVVGGGSGAAVPKKLRGSTAGGGGGGKSVGEQLSVSLRV